MWPLFDPYASGIQVHIIMLLNSLILGVRRNAGRSRSGTWSMGGESNRFLEEWTENGKRKKIAHSLTESHGTLVFERS
jgi:hypothetical protein